MGTITRTADLMAEARCIKPRLIRFTVNACVKESAHAPTEVLGRLASKTVVGERIILICDMQSIKT